MPIAFAIRRARLLVPLLALFAMAACTNQVATHPSPLPVAAAGGQAGPSYVIEPGDHLDLRFFYNPELNEEAVVRPDGNISLPLVGEVRAAGRSPSELEGALKEQYSRELRQAAITVIVKDFSGQRVFVDGEVGTPQVVPMTGTMTTMQAIAAAGGFKVTARKGEVLVIRRSGAERQVIPVDLEKAISGSDTAQDIGLKPYDIVFVPKSRVAELNTWLDQYIRQNIPIPFGLGYGLN